MLIHPIFTTAGGFILGILAMLLTLLFAAPALMILRQDSPLDFDTTLATLETTATARGWKVPAVHHLDPGIKAAGFPVGRIAVLELCHPNLAGRILAEESQLPIASMMPCRIAVYETAAGNTQVSRLNTALMARLFGGRVAAVMTEASAANTAMLAALHQQQPERPDLARAERNPVDPPLTDR